MTEAVTERRFEGKVVVITGAGAGIGRAITLRLSLEGATVVGLDRDAAALQETAQLVETPMTTLVGDVGDPEVCASAIEDTVTRHGRLDVLGNVAGIARSEHLADITVAQYRQLMAVNMDACFFLTQAAMPHLISTGGSVLSIASTAGLIGQAYSSTYAMSKAAVIQMTKALAMEFLKTGVRINAIAPGGINTALIQNFKLAPNVDPELMNRYHSIRGLGEVEDVASLFAYVASGDARAIHGAVLSIDHGLTTG